MQQSAMELPRDEESFLSDEDDEDVSLLDYEDHVAVGGDGWENEDDLAAKHNGSGNCDDDVVHDTINVAGAASATLAHRRKMGGASPTRGFIHMRSLSSSPGSTPTPRKCSPPPIRPPRNYVAVPRVRWQQERATALDANNIMMLVGTRGRLRVANQKNIVRNGVLGSFLEYKCAKSCARNCKKHLGLREQLNCKTVREVRQHYFPVKLKRMKTPRVPQDALKYKRDGEEGEVVFNNDASRTQFRHLVTDALVAGASAAPRTTLAMELQAWSRARLRTAVHFTVVPIEVSSAHAPIYVCDRFFALLLGQWDSQKVQANKTFRTIKDNAADRVLKLNPNRDDDYFSAHKTFCRDDPATLEAATWLADIVTHYASVMPTNQEVRKSLSSCRTSLSSCRTSL